MDYFLHNLSGSLSVVTQSKRRSQGGGPKGGGPKGRRSQKNNGGCKRRRGVNKAMLFYGGGGGVGWRRIWKGRRVHVTFDEVWIYISSMGLVERIHVTIFILSPMLPKYRVYINKMISLLSKCDWGKEKFKFFNY